MYTMTDTNTTSTDTSNRKYSYEDIEALTTRSRTVLVTIAEQTGTINPGSETNSPDNGETAHVRCTTTTLRNDTGLSNNEVNYELKKLSENYDFSVTTPLVKTVQQGIDDNGRQRPKRIELTPPGEQAVKDDVIEREQLNTGPDWFPSNTGTEEQLTAIADRIDTHETVLDELTAHLGYTRLTELVPEAQSNDGDLHRTDIINSDTPHTDTEYTVLESIERMYTGQRALKQSLEDLGGDPSKHIEQ